MRAWTAPLNVSLPRSLSGPGWLLYPFAASVLVGVGQSVTKSVINAHAQDTSPIATKASRSSNPASL